MEGLPTLPLWSLAGRKHFRKGFYSDVKEPGMGFKWLLYQGLGFRVSKGFYIIGHRGLDAMCVGCSLFVKLSLGPTSGFMGTCC